MQRMARNAIVGGISAEDFDRFAGDDLADRFAHLGLGVRRDADAEAREQERRRRNEGEDADRPNGARDNEPENDEENGVGAF